MPAGLSTHNTFPKQLGPQACTTSRSSRLSTAYGPPAPAACSHAHDVPFHSAPFHAPGAAFTRHPGSTAVQAASAATSPSAHHHQPPTPEPVHPPPSVSSPEFQTTQAGIIARVAAASAITLASLWWSAGHVPAWLLPAPGASQVDLLVYGLLTNVPLFLTVLQVSRALLILHTSTLTHDAVHVRNHMHTQHCT